MLMVVVDVHSKCLEVVPMSTTTTEKTLDMLCSMFARYELPEQLVSNNRPQFISSEFERFMKENGTKHIRTLSFFKNQDRTGPTRSAPEVVVIAYMVLTAQERQAVIVF